MLTMLSHGGTMRGRAVIAGHDNADVPTAIIARHVGMVLEDPETQITATTVESEVAFALENQCVPTAEIRARVAEALALDLTPPSRIGTGICFLDHMVDQFTSHGQLGVTLRCGLAGAEAAAEPAEVVPCFAPRAGGQQA